MRIEKDFGDMNTKLATIQVDLKSEVREDPSSQEWQVHLIFGETTAVSIR